MTSKPDFDYEKSMNKLEKLLESIESKELDVDEAIQTFEQGMVLIDQLENYLKTAENKIEKIKKKFQ